MGRSRWWLGMMMVVVAACAGGSKRPAAGPSPEAARAHTDEGLIAIVTAHDNWRDPDQPLCPTLTQLAERAPGLPQLDGWGNPYVIRCHPLFEVRSPGPDGRVNTGDDLRIYSMAPPDHPIFTREPVERGYPPCPTQGPCPRHPAPPPWPTPKPPGS